MLRPSSLAPKKFFPRLNQGETIGAVFLTKSFALVLFASYVLLLLFSVLAAPTPSNGSVALRLGRCQASVCVTWVMPASLPWTVGVRPGMELESVNGVEASEINGNFRLDQTTEIRVRTESQETLTVDYTKPRPIRDAVAYSLWVLSGMFVVIGLLVLSRRPDLIVSRWFAGFTWVFGVGLAVAPASANPGEVWALAGIALVLVWIGGASYPFISSLVSEERHYRLSITSLVFIVLAAVLTLLYFVGVGFPAIFDLVVQLAVPLLAFASLVGGVGLLAYRSTRSDSEEKISQSRIALFGVGLGTIPFIALTLIPRGFEADPIVEAHYSILATGLIPLAFAYAILQRNLLGIRRLVTRAMVYGLTTLATLVVITLTVEIVRSQLDELPIFLVSVLVTGGIVLFFPLRSGARWLVDKLLYFDLAHVEPFLDVLGGTGTDMEETKAVIDGIARRLLESLRLESVIIYLGEELSDLKLATAVGARSEEIGNDVFETLKGRIVAAGDRDVVMLRWEADSLMWVRLRSAGHVLGHVLLGPKEEGDMFVEEERNLVSTVAPLLALAVDQTILSDELRELNQMLIKAQEDERSRVAVDLHDGPLQKAILLTKINAQEIRDPVGLAKEIADDLREIGSSLRPSILDDLGLVSAIDWLLESAPLNRTTIEPRLSLNGYDEDDRFDPEKELALFRVTQEAINNAVKHSQATHIDVSLSKRNGDVILLINDDGVGFDSSVRKKDGALKGGVGLGGMRERLMYLGGEIQIDSSLGAGTSIFASLPVGADEQEGAEA